MEYIYDDTKELPWPEFFEIHKERFPLLVCITSGHYGETIYDDFCNDQIYRVQTYTSQRRVVIEAKKKYDPTVMYLSMPVSSTHKFRVILGHKSQDEPKTLQQILKEREFPISVKLEGEGEIQIGTGREDVQSFMTMLITRDYTENFLLGNCVLDGKIQPKLTIAALSDLISVSVVTGVEGKSPEFFRKHLTEMEKTLKDEGVKYDSSLGNPDITKITSNGTGTGNPIPKLNPPLIPTKSSFSDEEPSDEELSADDNYELPPKPTEPPKVPSRIKNPPDRNADRPQSSKTAMNPASDSKKPLSSQKITETSRPLAKTKVPYANAAIVFPNSGAAGKGAGVKNDNQSGTARKLPILPKPPIKEGQEGEYTYADNTDEMYEAMDTYIPKTPLNKVVEPETKLPKSDKTGNEAEQSSSAHTSLKDLTREDISSALRQLKLDKYVIRFYDDMIDGVILAEFSKGELKEAFGLTTVEQIRLWKFITTGHIPK